MNFGALAVALRLPTGIVGYCRARGKGSGAVFGTPLVIPYSHDMPRPRRAAEGGLIYQDLNRANARLAIFQTDADYAAFQPASSRRRWCAITYDFWLTA